MKITDDNLTFEELKQMCNSFFTDNELKTFYSHCEILKNIVRRCPDCKIPQIQDNLHLFYYNLKCTRCKQCSRRNSAIINEKRKNQRNKENI